MTRMSRRAFLRGTVALGAGAILYKFTNGWSIATAANGDEAYQLRIVHTNDHHARIEPTASVTIASGVTRDLGGVSRRKTLFDQIIADNTPPVGIPRDLLFLDAGDVFQGTLYFNQYQGQADLEFYNQLGYAAMAIGNHEFDSGDQVLADFIAGANFPILAANITAGAASPLAALYEEGSVTGGKWGPWTIIDNTTTGGKKIGIFSLTTADTANISSPSAAVTFNGDYIAVAQQRIDALRTTLGCEIVIALTHISYLDDVALAQGVRGLNLIVGGHSHSSLLSAAQSTQPTGAPRVDGPYPTVVEDLDGKSVIVVTDWEHGKWVGDLLVSFTATNEIREVVAADTLIRPVWAGGIRDGRELIADEGAEIVPNAAFETRIAELAGPLDELRRTKIGETTVLLSNAASVVREREAPLGNLVADALRELALGFGGNPQNLPIVTIINGGGLRSTIPVGDITIGSMLEVLPFGNTVALVDLTGAQLLAALENGVSALGGTAGTGRFAQVAGLRFKFARTRLPAIQGNPTGTPPVAAQRGERVLSVEVREGTTFQPLDLQKVYRVVTNDFMVRGGDSYFVFTEGGDRADPTVGGGTNQVDTKLLMVDAVIDYIRAQTGGIVSPEVEGRITEIRYAYLPFAAQPTVAAPEFVTVR
ncbi:bifunctional UDP-sugar hydrolase/5'-nucleotidase [Candidatus Chloroploca sp. Khr17]|uniref:bifunctional metallophosphatase/5'-nucleotidase n=1 Tax=Candidatus Chloroploca sp. Khr17 TaxID=2496869 RepID=UPI0013EA582C|nr:5'-nucleotidase C-terminal domain-containing protein [Candidatus Chloroploca sp. Khr17]